MDKSLPKSKRFDDFLENTYFKTSHHYYKLTKIVDEEKELNNYILFLESPTEINTSFEDQASGQNFAVVGENMRIRPASNRSRHHLAHESININEVESTTDININNKNEYIIIFNQGGGAIDEKITNILSITNSDMVDVNKIFKHANGLSINLSSDHSNLIQELAEVKSIELNRELKYTPPIKYLPADSPIDTFFKDNIYLENKSDQGDFSTKNISGLKTYADNFKKELNISDSYKSSNISINSLTAYNNTYASSGEILPYGVRAVWEGNDISEKGNIGIGSYAFVIDSGVLNTTNDLNVNTAWSKSFVEGEGAFEDGTGHGTHVSGTIAALANGEGVVGVAPGAEIISLKVFSNSGGGATYGKIIEAIDYSAKIINDNKLDKSKVVINLSLGGPFFQGLDEAVKNIADQGIRFAIAAGNSLKDVDSVSPASAGDHENVYTVSAVDKYYQTAWWSNYDDSYGGDDVDVSAPGVSVYSYYQNGNLAALSGTSMAAPHVAGLLLTGGVKEGAMAGANWFGYSDPFALTNQSIFTPPNPPPDTTPPTIAISSTLPS